MDSISRLLLTGEHILVKAESGSPLADDEKRIVQPVSFGVKSAQSCWGKVLATGPHPYLKDDYSEDENMIKVNDIVIFPPTSGFKLPLGDIDDGEYRIMAASVVAGIIPCT